MLHLLGEPSLLSWIPLLATVIVTIILVRSGTQQQLSQARKDTLELIKLRSDTIQSELDDCTAKRARLEQQNIILEQEARRKEDRVNDLWQEVVDLRKEKRELLERLKQYEH